MVQLPKNAPVMDVKLVKIPTPKGKHIILVRNEDKSYISHRPMDEAMAALLEGDKVQHWFAALVGERTIQLIKQYDTDLGW